MKEQHRKGWLAALLLGIALMAAACGGGGDDTDDTVADNTTTTEAGPPEFEAGTTMATIQERGKIIVGTKFDQPGFGLKNPTTNEVEGFDVEIAKHLAVAIFGGTTDDIDSKIEFVESVSKNREPYIQEGKVDIVVATYTINDTRKQVVDFAGPYFVAQQDIMTKKADTTINGVDDLTGKKVCTVKGSTSQKNVEAKAKPSVLTLFETYSQCAEALRDGRVDAVTTDDTILAGLVNASNDEFKLVKAPFSEEPYGIGLKKDDTEFRSFINDTLEDLFESGAWESAFEDTLGAIGLDTPEHPEVDRYGSTGGTTGPTNAPAGSGTTEATTARGSSTSTTSASSTTEATTARGSSSTTAAP